MLSAGWIESLIAGWWTLGWRARAAVASSQLVKAGMGETE